MDAGKLRNLGSVRRMTFLVVLIFLFRGKDVGDMP
jgi:hypothetical protein